MTAEFEETLIALNELKDGWAGESSEAPSKANIDLLRTILIEVPPEFALPEVRAGFNGELECVWREYNVYVTFTLDDELEISHLTDELEHCSTYDNTRNVDEMRELILNRLRKVSRR